MKLFSGNFVLLCLLVCLQTSPVRKSKEKELCIGQSVEVAENKS